MTAHSRSEDKFTTVLWDVDDTLLDFPYSQRHALEAAFRFAGRTMTEEIFLRYTAINDSFWKRLELGEITRQELLRGRFEELFRKFDIRGIDPEAFRLKYEEELGSVYRFRDDSLAICTALKGRIKQYVITNGQAAVQRSKLRLSGLDQVMDGIFISGEIGFPKPQRDFFDCCLAQLAERDPRRILLVGDSLSSDIRGGVQAGIPTCWYRPEGTANNTPYRPDYEISNLHEIFVVLRMEELRIEV